MSKRLLISFFAVIVCLSSKAQKPPRYNNYDALWYVTGGIFHDNLQIPAGGATPTLGTYGVPRAGFIYYDSVNSRTYVYKNGIGFRLIADTTDGVVNYATQGDVTRAIAAISFNASNVGLGYRSYSPQLGGWRTFFNSYALNWDSTSNTSGLTIKLDTTEVTTRDWLYKALDSLAAAGWNNNIYNSNGTLTGNRTIAAAGNDLMITGLDYLQLQSGSGATLVDIESNAGNFSVTTGQFTQTGFLDIAPTYANLQVNKSSSVIGSLTINQSDSTFKLFSAYGRYYVGTGSSGGFLRSTIPALKYVAIDTTTGHLYYTDGDGGGGVGGSYSFSSPLSESGGTVSIANSAADGSTKGAASFNANDFNASSGNISLDYTNAQKATTSTIGFLTDTDWDTFNEKFGNGGNSYGGLATLGTNDDNDLVLERNNSERVRVGNTLLTIKTDVLFDNDAGSTNLKLVKNGSFWEFQGAMDWEGYAALIKIPIGANATPFLTLGYNTELDAGGNIIQKIAGSTEMATSSTLTYLQDNDFVAGFYQQGAGTTARIESRTTSKPQYRATYDDSNYGLWTVGSSGINTIDAVGSSAKIVFSDDVEVPNEAYGGGWNGSTEVPTKDAVYDKIQSMSSSGEANTASNVGSGVGLFKQKTLVDLEFKSLREGIGIGITSLTDEVSLAIKGWNLWDVGTVQTTNNTTTTVATLTTTNDSRGIAIVYMVGTKTDNLKSITGAKYVHYKNIGGTVTLLGSVTDLQPDYLDGFSTATWTLDASGGTIRVRATGETSNTVDWSATYQLKSTTYIF